MAQAAEPPSGTRDVLAEEVRRRRAAFGKLSAVFEAYGFDPLETPAFERLEVFAGKLGEEASSLIFKILKRGVHEASGEADLALRYDHTVPLARVIGTYGSRLPWPFKRYAIGPVWRADRPARGRFREFTQCDIDTVGSSSPLADAEVAWAINDGLRALGIIDYEFQINSRHALHGLMEAYEVPTEFATGVLGSLDKLDKVATDVVVAELVDRGLTTATAQALIADVTGADQDRVRRRLDKTERGRIGLSEVERLLELTNGLPVRYAPGMVRGLDYYTGPIFEVTAAGYPGSIASGGRYDSLVAKLGGPDAPACGGSIGIERILAIKEPEESSARRLDVAVTVLNDQAQTRIPAMIQPLRKLGLRVGVYLGSSGKFAKQMKWANDQHAPYALIYGPDEQAAEEVTVRDMDTGEQIRIPIADLGTYLGERLRNK